MKYVKKYITVDETVCFLVIVEENELLSLKMVQCISDA